MDELKIKENNYRFLYIRDYTGTITETHWFTKIPRGWWDLISSMSAEIQAILDKSDIDPDDFYFEDINHQRGYLHFCASEFIPQIEIITSKYELLSTEICCMCGNKANLKSINTFDPYCTKCAATAKLTNSYLYFKPI